MKNIRVFLFAALALLLVFGAHSQVALAAGGLHFERHTIARNPFPSSAASPDTLAAAYQGVLAMGPLSLTSNPDSWPCFAPNPPCTSDPQGGMLIGEPVEVWSVASCNATSCGQIYWTFETGPTVSGNLVVSVVVKQGSSTILDVPSTNLGPAKPNQIEVITLDGAGFGAGFCPSGVTCATPVAGAATITSTTKVGSAKITGKANLTLQ